ncbi:MAG: hypothetical protein HY791_07405 [Deltaproteobacteria bacterium]|nr:hypothetical protein [Deltaproteobacteria bacterium]
MIFPTRGGVALGHELPEAELSDEPRAQRPATRPVSLGELYDRWMGEWLGPNALPGEPEASCDDCAMRPSHEEEPGRVYFDQMTRCCTFVPVIPNFLVGRILKDQSPDAGLGRESVIERIAMRRAVSPLGLERTLGFALKYRHTADAFGRKGSLRCPHHLDDGRCGIWRNRESTCSTWFCKPARGERSLALWRAIQSFLAVIERQLSFWCVRRLGITHDAVTEAFFSGNHPLWTNKATYKTHLFGSQLDGPRKSADPLGVATRREHQELWGNWDRREIELYEACADLVEPLSFEDLGRIVGTELEPAKGPVLETLEALEKGEIPTRLTARPTTLVQIRKRPKGEWVLASSYRAYDPRELPRELYEALPRFDGRATAEVIAEIETETGIRVEHDALLALVELGFLDEQGAKGE